MTLIFRAAIVVIFIIGLATGGIVLKERTSEQHAKGLSPSIGGAFELTSHRDERISNNSLAGKPYLAFFGFTNCPDVCPTTLFELTDLMKEIGPAADEFNVLLISVDPERDTQALLSAYMASFDERIIAVRGSVEETERVVRSFSATARKVPLEGGGYTIDHTAGVYLIDADGRFKGMLDMHEPKNVRLQKIKNLIEGTKDQD